MMTKHELDDLIDEYVIGRNAERDRKILRRKLYDGITFEQLAEEFGLSVRWAKEIVYRRQEAVFKHTRG